MDNREFFDKLYQMWSKTSWAKDRYWDYGYEPGKDYTVKAVSEDGYRSLVGTFVNEDDADWITALHGCFPDVFRLVNDSLDEADRADLDHDSRECRIAELELEVEELRQLVSRQREELTAAANELGWRER